MELHISIPLDGWGILWDFFFHPNVFNMKGILTYSANLCLPVRLRNSAEKIFLLCIINDFFSESALLKMGEITICSKLYMDMNVCLMQVCIGIKILAMCKMLENYLWKLNLIDYLRQFKTLQCQIETSWVLSDIKNIVCMELLHEFCCSVGCIGCECFSWRDWERCHTLLFVS